jgi:serine protease Do
MTIRSMMFVVILASCLRVGFAQSNVNRNPLSDLSASIRELTLRASQSVVEVSVNGYGVAFDNPGRTSDQVSRQHSIGSGVLVDSSGSIMTNAHVIDGATTVKVTLATAGTDSGQPDSPRVYNARIMGVDHDTDLALLKIDAAELPLLEFGNSDNVSQGDLVFAIGSRLRLRNSLSMGVVSGTARAVDEDNPVLYIQTDAAINPGDSGGALVDTNGRLIGLNTFIMSKSGGSEGIGFAVPANVVYQVYKQLLLYGTVSRGSIGIYVQDITPPMARGLSLTLSRGVLVADVEPQSPGDISGLKRRDVILRLDDQEIRTARQFNDALVWRQNGETARLVVQRGVERLAMSAAIRRVAQPMDLSTFMGPPDKSLISRLGLFCLEIDQRVLDVMPGLRKQYGLVVVARLPESQAEAADLRSGDVIHALGTLPIATLDMFRKQIDSLHQGDGVALQVERDGRLRFVAFDIQ